MDPRVVFGIAGGVLAFSLTGLWLTRLPLLWAPVFSLGITFACASWVGMRKYYPGKPALWVFGAFLTLLPMFVAMWVVQEAGSLAGQLAVRRQDSDLNTEINTMLRDKPEEYPVLGEGLRQERILRIREMERAGQMSARTADYAKKALEYLESKLPLERGFQYRVGTEARLRDATLAVEGAPSPKPKETLACPREGMLVVLEDRANLKPLSGERYVLTDLFGMKGISLRAACTLGEAEWLVVVSWSQPVLKDQKHTYPARVRVLKKEGAAWVAQGERGIADFAQDQEIDAEADTAASRGFNLGERPRSEAIRSWLQAKSPGPTGG